MTEADLTALQQLFATAEPAALGPNRRAGTLPEAELNRALDPILQRAGLTPTKGELIRALLLLWHDHLDASHTLSQNAGTADGSFIHAIMHRREPDAGNAKYWWRRVGSHRTFPEIARRVDSLLRSSGAGDLAKRLSPGGKWDANAFVDACDAALALSEADPPVKLLREIQRIETEVLLEHLVGGAK